MAGYIKLHRGWHDSRQFSDEPYCERAAWCWLLTNAAWKDTKRRNHRGEVVEVRRGQFHTSLRVLSAEWHWSIKRVRTFLNALEKCDALGTQRAQGGTVITICKYDEYQANGHEAGTQEASHGARKGHTQEEGKEGKEEKNNSSYAFAGKVIRLTAADLGNWKRRYSRVQDIDAELGALDDWLFGQGDEQRKKWFHIVSGALNKKHQAAIRSARDDEEELPIC